MTATYPCSRSSRARQRVDRGVDGGRVAEPVATERTHLDRAVGEGGSGSGTDAGVEQLAGRRLGALDVGLVEGVDAEQPPGDGRGGLPEDQLRAQRAGDA